MTVSAFHLDLLPDAVLRLDAERRVVEANAAAAALTGWSPDDMRGRALDELLSPRARDGKPLVDGAWHRSVRLRSVVRT